jgi:CRP/FNR family cyclic AMP-dependent transcriptional regulator
MAVWRPQRSVPLSIAHSFLTLASFFAISARTARKYGWQNVRPCCQSATYLRCIKTLSRNALPAKDADGCGPKNAALIPMPEPANPDFDPVAFLAESGPGRSIVQLKSNGVFFSQGSPADSIFYLQKGRAKVTVVSKAGKEATINLLAAGDFVGEESLAGRSAFRLATANAVTACTALKIDRQEMIRVLHEERSFSDLFIAFLLARSLRTQADLVDHLFNSSEKRLARILLLMAEFGQPGEQDTLIPPITQETLADMIGTTRSRVSFFMNRFRKRGFIDYNGRIRVNKSLLNVVLHDQTSGEHRVNASLLKTKNDNAAKLPSRFNHTQGDARF